MKPLTRTKLKYKAIILVFSLVAIISLGLPTVKGVTYSGETTGYILLQVESKGEAWYIYPANNKAYYLGRPYDAFKIMKELALGAKHNFIIDTNVFPERLSGTILLDVEKNGEAYYIYPGDRKKYYLGRPEDAFKIMRELGRGITNSDLARIPVGITGEPMAKSMTLPKANEKILINDVPFTTQAPFGDWSDSRQQNGCEESSALMAMKWVQEKSLSKEESLKEITGISDWLKKKYGESRDTSAQDTLDWIFKDYFQYDQVVLKKDVTINDIVEELSKGHLVLAPMNGQIVHNPNYRPPGPGQHMMVIRGFDPTTEEFITNDPGTRNGESYYYDKTILYNAIRDYPTGYHETIKEIEKNIIVVSK
ncbi:hypothetical protein CVU82_01710 [Candidatus Falkowbacteria bacterium HGW-Falkowbacteria-1]|jgi:hypothetical protein|uniref:Peptidase C39-like domain-containing protein n=1 Tax=Candidatus Falkowbacteria bacterium HGW-Falkowbacteria-1 TaxID=2013768 RepID=A0A2N2E9E9_9BACT|nr:MAG: hypothetical protein CVU82_01710 [Candidatus Falkowbacteria bacterium HGW-Falkowbacteria-1]